MCDCGHEYATHEKSRTSDGMTCSPLPNAGLETKVLLLAWKNSPIIYTAQSLGGLILPKVMQSGRLWNAQNVRICAYVRVRGDGKNPTGGNGDLWHREP